MRPSSNPPKISRRRFVKLSAAGAAAALAGSFGVLGHRKQVGPRHVLERVQEHLTWARHAHLAFEERIRQHFSYLQLDPKGVSAFAADFERHRGRVGRFLHPRDDPFERYLLSTDFFQNGADESRLVRYVLFYDPYLNPCWNPFVPPVG